MEGSAPNRFTKRCVGDLFAALAVQDTVQHPIRDLVHQNLIVRDAARATEGRGQPYLLNLANPVVFWDRFVPPMVILLHDLIEIGPLDGRLWETRAYSQLSPRWSYRD